MYNLIMTDDLCSKCGECCKNIRADFNTNRLYWDDIQPLTEEFSSMLIETETEGVYKCRFLKDNLCTNSDKPDICKNYPASPFVNLTENCTYNGFIFLKFEKFKQKIRKLKEEILHYKTLIETTSDKKEKNQLQKIVDSHKKFINKYKIYGSDNW